MATRPPLLTKKRAAWADQRAGHRFKGATLNYNAATQDKYVQSLQALVKQMTAQTTREFAKLARSFGDAPGTAMDADPASQARILANKLTVKFEALFTRKAKALADRMVRASSAASKTNLHASLKEMSGGLSLKTDLLTGGLKTILTATVAENVSLIKSIPAQYMKDVAGSVFRAIQTGDGLADIVPKLAEVEGVTMRRARNIALDQTRKTYNAINRERMKAVGVKKFEWIHSGGGQHPRELHMQMDGEAYAFDDLPVIDERTGERGIPGQAVNCLPGASTIERAEGCHKMFRRGYASELVSLVTDDGVILEATPNHPILTSDGWKPVKLVNPGDYVFQSGPQGAFGSEANIHHSVPRVAQLFDAALALFGRSGTFAAGASFEFHGDAADHDVDIVDIASYLPRGMQPQDAERFVQLLLAWAEVSGVVTVPADGPLDAFLVGIDPSSDGLVCGYRPLLALFGRGGAHAESHRRALTAYVAAVLAQDATDDSTRHVELLSELQFADPFRVGEDDGGLRQLAALLAFGWRDSESDTRSAEMLGEIVGMDAKLGGHGFEGSGAVQHPSRVNQKVVREYTGHVYNLENVKNWYVANGIITHNCRCTMRPIVDFGEDETE